MGQVDTIELDTDLPDADVVLIGVACAAGHAQHSGLQTTDFDPEGTQYILARDVEGKDQPLRLFGPGERHSRISLEHTKDPVVFEVRRSRFPLSTFTGEIVVCTHCDECLPVFFERPGGFWGNVDKREVFVEIELTFVGGRLMKVAGLERNVSREVLRATMLKDGVAVLPDDDRLVKREIEAWTKGQDDE